MIDISSYHPQRKLLANKVILITGSTSGIGREASITFSQFGAKTILLGKNIELLEETYELIVSNNLEKPILHVLDFDQAKEEEYFQLAESVLQEYGKLDGPLNNAGILGKKSFYRRLQLEGMEKSPQSKFRIRISAYKVSTSSIKES